MAEVLAANCTFTYVEGYGDCLTFSGDAEDLAAALAAAGFGPVEEAVEVTEADWREAAEMEYEMDFGEPNPVYAQRAYTEALAEAWDNGAAAGLSWNENLGEDFKAPNPYRLESDGKP